MDRTTKSIRLRDLSQWTAATTLVAAGSLALLSAHTLDKLSENGDVAIDLQAFRKLGSASLALDRVDEAKLFAEEARLLDRAAYAAREKLPTVKTAFAKIRLAPKKRVISREIAAKTESPLPTAAVPGFPPEARRLAGSPVVLSSADAAEVADLERVTDATIESQAIAQIYRNLRFQFVAAVEGIDTKEYPIESIVIAQTTEAFEYDEVPEFRAEDFALPETSAVAARPSVETDETDETDGAVETAPAKLQEFGDSIRVADLEPARDEVPVSASSALTADPRAMNDQLKPDPTPSRSETPKAELIATPGLDLIPESRTVATMDSQGLVVSSHESEVKQATGPPDTPESSENPPPTSLQAKSPSGLEANPEKIELEAPNSVETPSVSAVDLPADAAEYSRDIASVYEGIRSDGEDTQSKTGGYSNRTLEDSIIDGDFSARPNSGTVIVRDGSPSHNNRTVPPGAPARPGTSSRPGTTVAQNAPFVGNPANAVKDLGHGVRRDDKGITIDWSADESDGGKYADTELGGKVFVGKPGLATANTALVGAKALVTSQSSAALAEPTIDTKKCETIRAGVEAFNLGAEKETLPICRRELSLEGAAGGDQARWWESYQNDSDHWPTLSYQKPGEANATNRTPVLSNASIRILSAISKTNTHTGTGILFGEVAKGLEIQLLGRSDSPIYLDAGLKPRAGGANDTSSSRPFVFLNVEPGQPLLVVRDRAKNLSGAIPLVVKGGMATHVKVAEPREMDLDLTVFDASSAKESRLSGLTAEVIGQPGKMGITDRLGNLRIRKVAVFGEFPVYLDLLKSEKSYKNRFRVRAATIARGNFPLFFFDEKRVGGWLAQLAGGISPYSGLIAGVAPAGTLSNDKKEERHLKIGILVKKSPLVPERYLLDDRDGLVTDPLLKPGRARYIGVQVPEGPAIPTIVDGKGKVLWSELVYAQPGVVNVVGP